MARNLGRLSELLNEAAYDARFWDAVCEEVSRIFGATGTLIPNADPEFRGLWTAGTKRIKEALAEYLDKNWMQGDPREKVLNGMFERGYCTDDEIFPDREARMEMPIYRDFLNPWNFGNVCMIRLLTPDGYWPLTVHFANDHPPLEAQDLALISDIQVLFEQATKKASEVAHRRIHSFSEFLSGSMSEVYVFNADGNQCFTIDHRGRMRTKNRLDRLLPSEISAVLQRDLKDVLLSDPSRSLSKSYQFSQDGLYINVLAIQIPPSLRHFFMAFKTCAIRTECSQSNMVRNRTMRDRFGLSDAEVATVEYLASGKTPAAIADMLGLKPASIRQRLKPIYCKVGVSGQVELVASYLRM